MDETEYLSNDKQLMESINDDRGITYHSLSELTIKTLQDSKEGKNLHEYKSTDEMFDECWDEKSEINLANNKESNE